MLGAILTIAGGAVVLKVLGYARDAGIAARFGLGAGLDAYMVAQNLTAVLVGLLVGEGGGRLAILFVPLYTEVRLREGREEAWRLTLTIFNICLLILTAIAALMIAFPHATVLLSAPGFEPTRAAAASRMIVILAASTIGLGLTGFMRGYLIANGRYLAVTIAPALGGLVVVLYVLTVAPRFGMEGVAWCTLAASFLPVVIQFPFFLAGGGYRPHIHWSDPAVRRIGRLFVPVVFGMSVTQLGAYVDQVMASMLPAGHLSALTYANRLRAVPFFLFVMSTEQAVFPRLCAEYTARGLAGLREMGHFAMRIMIALSVPTVVALVVLRQPVARLAFGHGAVDADGVRVIAGALGFYMIGLLATCIAPMPGNAFFALQDTRTPTILAAIALGVNIIGNFILIRPMGANGLALATSISGFAYLGLSAWALRRRVPGLLDRSVLGMYARAGSAALIMGAVCAALAHRVWGGGFAVSTREDALRLALVAAVGFVVYAAAAVAFRVEGVVLAGRLAMAQLGRLRTPGGA